MEIKQIFTRISIEKMIYSLIKRNDVTRSTSLYNLYRTNTDHEQ